MSGGIGKRIILGSNSPRRRELMAGLGLPFTVDTGNSFEECYAPDTPHEIIPTLMSEGKSAGFHRPLEEDEILITADTMVLLHDRGGLSPILGKPHSREEAVAMLHELSGRTHEVITSVTIRDTKRKETFSDSTLVTFRPLADEEIEWYVDNYRPYDKAGSYGVQEWIGYVAITGIQGSFYNVMGFPTHKVYERLRTFLK